MAFSGLGSGILGDPYQITTWAQFKEISNELSAHYKLMNDIDAAQTVFSTTALTFSGNLDGGGYKVLNVKYPSNSSNPLFFHCSNAVIKRVKLYPYTFTAYRLFSGSSHTSGGIQGTTFEDVEIYNYGTNSTYQGIVLSTYMLNSTFVNVKIFSKKKVSIATKATGNIFNNLIIQSFDSIDIANDSSYTFTSNNLSNCKFIVQNKNQKTINIYKPVLTTFTDCLFYGSYYSSGYTTGTSGRNSFTRCSFLGDIEIAVTGVINTHKYIIIGYVNALFTQCYFGNKIKVSHYNYSLGTYYSYKLFYVEDYSYLTDCHFDMSFDTVWDVAPTGFQHSIFPVYVSPLRCFFDFNVTGFVSPGLSVANGTNIFVNSDKILSGLTKTANFTLLNTAQTKQRSNFTGFDFSGVWENEDTATSPKLRNVIYDAANYFADELLNSISILRISGELEQLTINTYKQIPDGATLNCYVSNSLTDIERPENEIDILFVDSYLSKCEFNPGEGIFYISVVYQKDAYRQELNLSAYHYSIDQKPTTNINIVTPNYKNFTTPRAALIHGAIMLNNYFYGCARGAWNGIDLGENIIKLKADDYAVYSTKKIYSNKTGATGQLAVLDQIAYCKGFLWCLSNGILIRINPSDLDYMTFAAINTTNNGQPIGADENYLYITTNTHLYKIDAAQMIGTMESYGYTGAAPVAIPPAAILGNYEIIQNNPTYPAYAHSIVTDNKYIYLALTTNSYENGYTNGVYTYQFQKINKATMQLAGRITIPKCTDDMVQNGEYVFLAPELVNTTLDIFGSEYGLLAIRKSDLTIKYLKALHSDFNTVNESDRQCYGVHYFEGYIIVQLVSSKKSVVINTSQVDQWGANFPIGGATESVVKFQKEGVDLAYPQNELVIDGQGYAHITTWANPVDVLKFPTSATGITINRTPNLQTNLLAVGSGGATLGGYVIDEGNSAITAVGFRYGTNPANLTETLAVNPVSYDFQAVVTLQPGIYYFQAYGTNNDGTYYGNIVPVAVCNVFGAVHNSAAALLEWVNSHFGCSIRLVQDAAGVADGTTGTMTDNDGNVYDTIVISGLRWMVQNLKTTKYRNGEAIQNITENSAWGTTNDGAYCSYNNNNANI